MFWEGIAGAKAGLQNLRGTSHSSGWGESRVPAAHISAVLPCSHLLALPLRLAPAGTEIATLVPLQVWPVNHWIPLPVHDKMIT